MAKADSSVPLNICSFCLLIHSLYHFFFPLMQVINHTIILLRGNDLHTFNTPSLPY